MFDGELHYKRQMQTKWIEGTDQSDGRYVEREKFM